MALDIFEHTIRPNEDIFYQRNDPNDPRLGEFVTTFRATYDSADVVIVGCPQDEGVRRNKGRLGAKDAPDAIRQALYKLVIPPNKPAIFDLGNTQIDGSLEEIHTRHGRIIQQIIADGKRVIALGGGNDLSYPDCLGLSSVVDKVLAFNIDAHFDVRADEPRNSGTPYRQLLEDGFIQPKNFYELGYQPFANSEAYHAYLDDKGVAKHSLESFREQGIGTLLHKILDNTQVDAIFWGLDMDVVRGSDAPGVSALNPTGLTGEEFCLIAEIAGHDARTRLFEITEVNPTYDIDGRTARLAAVAIHAYLRQVNV